MNVAGLEVNDAGVILGLDGRVLVESPGYALEDDAGTWIGEPARARARLAPRLVNHTFWERLDTEPAPRPVGRARTHADLVALHLERVWEHREPGAEAVVLAVPGSLGRSQLGLLLGVAEAIALPVHGLVDGALAALAGAGGSPGGPALHVEAGLHGVVATRVDCGDDLRVVEARRLDAPGLLAIDELLAKAVAARFVRETRFDPRHSAASEQALYAGLRGWVQRLASAPATVVELGSTTGARHSVEIAADDLRAALEPVLGPLVHEVVALAPAGCRLCVGHQLAAVPFVIAALGAALGAEPETLGRGASALGAARHAESIHRAGGARSLTRRLGADAPAQAPVLAAGPPPRPTHVVLDGLAHPIGERRFAIGRSEGPGDGFALGGAPDGAGCVLIARGSVVVLEPCGPVSLNGRVLSGPEPVSAGDRLGFPGTALELLLVAVSDGTPA